MVRDAAHPQTGLQLPPDDMTGHHGAVAHGSYGTLFAN